MNFLFIPNWNGHLYLQDYKDNSVTKLFKNFNNSNKKLLKIKQNNINETNLIIKKEFEKTYKNNSRILSITGDHSNSYPLIKAFSKFNKNNFKLIIFDAHPDVEISTDLVSHEDYLRNLIEDKIVNPENIYLFGIRTFSRTEFNYLLEKKINFYSISDILKNKNEIINILSNINSDIYLSIDIDVLDPDDAPGTYYREWCGLHFKELNEFIQILKPKIKSMDITEFYNEKDKNEITFNNILKLINQFK